MDRLALQAQMEATAAIALLWAGAQLQVTAAVVVVHRAPAAVVVLAGPYLSKLVPSLQELSLPRAVQVAPRVPPAVMAVVPRAQAAPAQAAAVVVVRQAARRATAGAATRGRVVRIMMAKTAPLGPPLLRAPAPRAATAASVWTQPQAQASPPLPLPIKTSIQQVRETPTAPSI